MEKQSYGVEETAFNTDQKYREPQDGGHLAPRAGWSGRTEDSERNVSRGKKGLTVCKSVLKTVSENY